jgi:hypothetical protein
VVVRQPLPTYRVVNTTTVVMTPTTA